MTGPADITFRCMGSDVRLIVEAPLAAATPPPLEAVEAARAYIEGFAARLSRFRPDSELSALNDDPRSEVPASLLLRTAIDAGLWAAQRTDGLVDPTLVGEIEAAGYVTSREHSIPASLTDAIRLAPPRRPARASSCGSWRKVSVDHVRGTVRRPPGVRIDTGGTGKGLAADAVAYRLARYRRFVVDCGGDIAVGGVGALFEPVAVDVEHPLTGETVRTLKVGHGGVATSGLNVRIWRGDDGRFVHHLLDPSTGEPAWSGLIGATALAPSALEAETLAKQALLTGAAGARRALAAHGGLVVHDDGDVEWIGPLAEDSRPAPPMREAA